MSTLYPNLGLTSDFEPCEDALASINENFKRLDNLLQSGVGGVVSTLPASPSEGEAVILAGTNQLNVYSNGSWTAYTPQPGWHFIDTTDCSLQVFDGAFWKKLPLPSDYTAFFNNAANLGTGAGVFAQATSNIAEFRSLVAGTGLSVTETPTEIIIQSTAASSGTNLGTGEAVFVQIAGQDLEFKTITAGNGISVSSTADEVEIAADQLVAGNNIAIDSSTTPGQIVISTDLTNNSTNAVHVATGFQSFNGGPVSVQFTSDVEVSTALVLDAGNSIFTVAEGGLFVLSISLEMFPSAATSSAVVSNVRMLINGVERAGSVVVRESDPFSGGVGTTHNIAISRTLNVGDTVEVTAIFSETPVDPSLNYSFLRTSFNGVKIS